MLKTTQLVSLQYHPSWVSYGMSIVRILEKIYHVIMRPDSCKYAVLCHYRGVSSLQQKVVCCRFDLWLSSALAIAVLYGISCYIEPCYNSTSLKRIWHVLNIKIFPHDFPCCHTKLSDWRRWVNIDNLKICVARIAYQCFVCHGPQLLVLVLFVMAWPFLFWCWIDISFVQYVQKLVIILDLRTVLKLHKLVKLHFRFVLT